MLTIGLTGGIGSGKSSASKILGELGAAVIDADRVGHYVYAPGRPGWTPLVDAFGQGIVAPDGTIDRRKLGAIVFADPAALARLNSILHPLMADEIRSRLDRLRAGSPPPPAAVVEAAVLIEAGWDKLVDEVWLIVVRREQAVARIVASRALDAAEAERVIDRQISDAERQRLAASVIDNSGSPLELRAALGRLWRERVAGRAGGPR